MSFAVAEITLSQELSSIIIDYQDLKNKIKRQLILCILATMSVAISSKLSYVLLLTTLICVTGTLIFLTVTMQNTIYSLFDICYKKLHSLIFVTKNCTLLVLMIIRDRSQLVSNCVWSLSKYILQADHLFICFTEVLSIIILWKLYSLPRWSLIAGHSIRG